MRMYAIYRRGEESETVHDPVALYWHSQMAEDALHGKERNPHMGAFYVIKPVEVSVAPVREEKP